MRLEKVFLYRLALYGLKKLPFPQTKRFSFAESFTLCPQKPLFLCTKSLSFAQTFPYLLSKAILFCPPSPIRTTLNLLFAKNTAVLLFFTLILCCKAGASHRFKSLPAIPGEVAAFHKTGYLMNAGCFRKNTVSTGDLNRSPESRGSQTSGMLFGYFLHDAKRT